MQRRGDNVVLARILIAALLLAGCKESLFDSHGNGGTGDGSGSGDGMMVPTSCPATCLADAAADFDGTAGGSGNHWAYLDDQRNRRWAAMTPQGGILVGADPSNKIAKCAGSSPSACAALPGALLVATAGATSGADPALAYTATANQIIQLSVRVQVPSGAPAQLVRLYRNSREDVLFTGTAMPGMTLEQAVTVDAIANDRFLLAIAPPAMGGADIGVQFFVSATGAAFPAACQLALSFSAASGNTVANACGSAYTSKDYNTGAAAPALAAGPFTELGMAADIVPDKYYEGADVLVKTGDTTTQLWIRHDMFVPSYAAFTLTDVDLNQGGGLSIGLFDNSGTPNIEINTCTDPNAVTFAYVDEPWPNDHLWHFVRVVHTAGQVRLCVDGVRVGSFAAATGQLKSTFHPYIGRDVIWTPSGAFFDGGIDDVRVFTGALPCEP